MASCGRSPAQINPYLDENLIQRIRGDTYTETEFAGLSAASHSHAPLLLTNDHEHSFQSIGGLDEHHDHCEHTPNDPMTNPLHAHLSSPRKFMDIHEPISLNVGGVKYQTTLTTLAKYKCLFYKMFEGNFSNKPSKDGSYFIDRNGKYFEYILDFLRNGQLNIPTDAANSYLIDHLLSEADYYQIGPLIQELKFLKIGSKLLKPRNLRKIEKWIMQQFPDRKYKIFQWKLLYQWNCDDITLKNPYNVMHAKCEGISSILIVLLCGNRLFGAYTTCKWKAKDVADGESFVYWLGKEVIANDLYDESKTEDSESHNVQNQSNERKQERDNGDRKYQFHYDSYREFQSFDSNSKNHRCLKFCGGYNDIIVARYRAAEHQYGHFSIYTNETGYTVTASGPLSLDNSMHLQRMEIFHI